MERWEQLLTIWQRWLTVGSIVCSGVFILFAVTIVIQAIVR